MSMPSAAGAYTMSTTTNVGGTGAASTGATSFSGALRGAAAAASSSAPAPAAAKSLQRTASTAAHALHRAPSVAGGIGVGGPAGIARHASMAAGSTGGLLARQSSGAGLTTFGGLTGGDSRSMLGGGGSSATSGPVSFGGLLAGASASGIGSASNGATAAAGGFAAVSSGRRVGFVAMADDTRSRGATAGGGINRKRLRDEGHSRDGFPHMGGAAGGAAGADEPTSFGNLAGALAANDVRRR